MVAYAIGGAAGYPPSGAAREYTLTDSLVLVGVAAGVFATGLPFLIYARRMQRELKGR
jgi:hypothetical protein